MSFRSNLFCILFFIQLLFFYAMTASSEPIIPEPLQEWVGWVLHNQEDQTCTSSYTGKKKFCVWPKPLEINVLANGGNFRQSWKMENSGWIILPGDRKNWPQEVKINSTASLVVERGGYPALFVKTAGEYLVEGLFQWNSLPESVVIPQGTGLVSPFTIHGKDQVARITSNKLWISKKIDIKKQEQDLVQTQVYRRITDTIPMVVTTHIVVRVSGKPRELIVDWELPNDQIPVDLQCSVPVKIGPDMKIHMQARPGSYTIRYTSKLTNPVEMLELARATVGPDQEYWSFESQNNLRIVKISGVPAVDPSQTSIPRKWHSLPAYLINKGDTMRFETVKRGDTEPAPNNFKLKRRFWLDASGKGITVQDSLIGIVHKDPRLEMQSPGKLGRVTINGKDQLITKTHENGNDGVEVRQGSINAQAVSRLEGTRDFPAGGWGQTIDSLSAELLLQPGWKLFHAQGIDSTRSWISRWTLLDCFIVLIVVIACFKILGAVPSIVALIALGLSYHDHGAPVVIWLSLLACNAILKTAPNLKYIRTVRHIKFLLAVGFVVVVLPYSVQQLRFGIYPQLERSNARHLNTHQAQQVPKATQEQREMLDASEEALPSVSEYVKQVARVKVSPNAVIRKEATQQLDTQSKVQSGPGLPNRMWNRVVMKWNGPVDADLHLKLYLIGPLMNMLLIFLKTTTIFILAFFMIRPDKDNEVSFTPIDSKPGGKVVATAIILLTLFGYAPTGHCSVYPSQEILDTLQERLLAPPKCVPQCADFDYMDIELVDNQMSVSISVNALEQIGVPLPTTKGVYWQSIKMDNKNKSVLSKDNALWLKLPKGRHEITMKGSALKTDFQFNLPLKPHFVRFRSGEGWSIAGIDANGVPEDQLQFVKQEKRDPKSFGESTLPPSIKLERNLHLGVDWYITSTLVRLSPVGTSVYLKIPLLKGESVTDERYMVEDNHIEINMGPNVQSMQWISALQTSSSLLLKAPDTTKWSEVWRLNTSPIWHVEPSGSPVIQYYSSNKSWQPEWHPWPKEEVKLKITRPPGVDGSTKTIDSSKLKIVPGLRSTSMELSLVVRATRGDQQQILLPSDLTLQSVKINGLQQPIKNDPTVVIPLTPGSQKIKVKMNSPKGISTLFKVPEIKLSLPSVNSEIEIKTGSRWVWFVKGPQTGPAILFYSELLIILLAAIILGFSGLTPLSSVKWVVLGLGLSQSGLVPCVVIVSWFIALQFRKTKGLELKGGTFNGLQVLLVLLTIASCGALIYAVQHGLLGHPDMQIAGNGSNSNYLRWYQDHISEILPQPIVVSIPIMAYRVLMLLWALWLAYNLLSWVKWGWECLTSGKNWEETEYQKKRKEAKDNRMRETKSS